MKLSILICAYNEGNKIGGLLQNLCSQRLPPEITDYEILVVASGCTDRTVPVVRHFAVRNRRVKLIQEDRRRGKAAALNRGLEATSGRYVALIPADVLPEEDALYHLLTPFRNPEVTAVTGQPKQDPHQAEGGLIGYLMSMTFRLWGRLMKLLNHQEAAGHSSGEFMAVKREVVNRIPEQCAADDSYIAILARKKGVIKFQPRAVCYNTMPSNPVDYMNQRRRWLFGHFQTRRLTGEYPTVMDTLIFSQPELVIKVLAEEIKEHTRQIPYLIGAILFETVIYATAMTDLWLHRQYAVWPIIKSTKVRN